MMKIINKYKPLFAALVLCSMTYVSQAEPLVVGMLNFPPYYLVENDNKIKGGYFTDFLKLLLKRSGVQFTLNGYPPKRLYDNISDGTVHLWMGPVGAQDLDGKVIVSKKQIAEINLQIFTTGSADTLPKTLDELNGKSVIVVRGYSYSGLINTLINPKNNVKVETANSHIEAFQMLQAGRATYLLDYIQPANETLSQLNFPYITGRSIRTLPVFIMISKTLPDAQDTMNKIMKTYDIMSAESRAKAEALYKKH